MELRVNNRSFTIPRQWREDSLLFVLREHLGLVGAKFGCGDGLCGACTVLIDDVARRSCIVSAEEAAGRRIETIESLADKQGNPHPLQRAWLEESVPQCGYCQSGQIMSAAALLRANPKPTESEIAEAMAGNLCRCGTQQRIGKAIRKAAGTSS